MKGEGFFVPTGSPKEYFTDELKNYLKEPSFSFDERVHNLSLVSSEEANLI